MGDLTVIEAIDQMKQGKVVFECHRPYVQYTIDPTGVIYQTFVKLALTQPWQPTQSQLTAKWAVNE